MQYINSQTNNFNIIQSLASLSLLTFLFFWKGEVICISKIVRFILFFNLLTLRQCLNNPIQLIDCLGIITYFLMSISTDSDLNYIKRGSMILITLWLLYTNPNMIPLIIISEQSSKRWKNRKVKYLYMFFLVSTSIFTIFCLKKQTYFSENFTKNSGLMWILYSHLFSRYLKLYQTILILTPFMLMVPLSLSTTHSTIKIAIIFYASIFVSPHVTLSQLLTLYLFESWLYRQMQVASTKKNMLIWRVLTVMCIVITVPAYAFYERVSYLWLHSQMVSVGYFLLHLLLFWGTHAVYLAEGVKMIGQQDQQEKIQKGIVQRLKQYLLDRIQNL